MRKKLLVLGLAIAISTGVFASRIKSVNGDMQPWFENSTFGLEQKATEENQMRMISAQPPVEMTDSLERKQVNKRTELWNDPYKIAYLYVFLEGQGCIGYFTIKGKVSSVNSTITNPEQVLETDIYNNGSKLLLFRLQQKMEVMELTETQYSHSHKLVYT